MLPEDERPPAPLAAGTVVAERYRVGKKLGEGAMGSVYYAEHVTVGRPVAIKVLSHHWTSNPAMLERFRKEARAASAAGHPGIVEVFDAGELPDKRPYLAMEYLAGRDLWQLLSEDRPLEVGRACRLMQAVARALAAAHDVGIVHRDLKAENVMVVGEGADERIKVVDFGIAAGTDLSKYATTPGTVIGTPAYMAPEQAAGVKATPAFDIYAIGILLFELVAGRMPFEADSPLELLAIKATQPAPSIATFREGLPAELVALVDESIALDPADRPASAADVARRLQAVLDGLGAASEPKAVLLSRPGPVPPRPSPKGWYIAAGLALLVVATVGWFWPPTAEAPGTPATARAIEESPPAPPAVAPIPAPEPDTPLAEEEAVLADDDGPVPPPDPEAIAAAQREAQQRGAATSSPPDTPGSAEDAVEPVAAPPPRAPAGPSERECSRARDAARDARRSHLWSAVLTHTKDRRCWSGDRSERKRLRVQSLLETGDFEACVRLGRGASDSETKKRVALCERKQGQ